ncbi:MAG: alkaline phosphatase family protein, partial [Flavobacteriales bacterium]|nr:alkaline phosphatase family protein [Flavobacteriales bacterium]
MTEGESGASKKTKILIIGWDAADWKIMQPLIDKGLMPATKKLIENGASGKIATLEPPFSPMLWTSIATGKTPEKHGILDFLEADTETGGIRPVNVTSRKSRAFWNILNSEGWLCNLVGWWPSHPAEPINGNIVSNFFHKEVSGGGDNWPVKDGSVHPKSLTEALKKYRIHFQEITSEQILPFIPEALNIKLEENLGVTAIAKTLANTATVHATCTYLMDNSDWDLTAVYFDGIDHFCHGFIKYHPPQLSGLSDNLFNYYKEVVSSAYRFHDMMLERQLQLAGEDTIVVLLSDHGFESGSLRLRKNPDFHAGPAMDHAPYGVLIVNGPGIVKNKKIHGASLLDITPTLLTLAGLPVGEDMDGKVLTELFETPPTVTSIPSWENVEGDFGEHPDDLRENPEDAAAEMQQLIDLGYVEEPGEDLQLAAVNNKRETNFNLGLVYRSKGDERKALELFEEVYEGKPDEMRYILQYATQLIRVGAWEKARRLVNELKNHPDHKQVNIPLLESKLFLGENKLYMALTSLEEA